MLIMEVALKMAKVELRYSEGSRSPMFFRATAHAPFPKELKRRFDLEPSESASMTGPNCFSVALLTPAGVLIASFTLAAAPTPPPLPKTVEFNRDIRPILSDTC